MGVPTHNLYDWLIPNLHKKEGGDRKSSQERPGLGKQAHGSFTDEGSYEKSALSERAALDREIHVSYFMTCVLVPFCSLSR